MVKIIFFTKAFLFVQILLFNLCENVHTETTVLIDNVKIEFTNNEVKRQIDFVVTSSLGKGVSINDAWLAVGLNSINKMVLFYLLA